MQPSRGISLLENVPQRSGGSQNRARHKKAPRGPGGLAATRVRLLGYFWVGDICADGAAGASGVGACAAAGRPVFFRGLTAKVCNFWLAGPKAKRRPRLKREKRLSPLATSCLRCSVESWISAFI